MTIDHHYWEYDYKHHCARQVEKEALESHFQKQRKASISGPTVASQNKANISLMASFAKTSLKLSLSSALKKQPNTSWVDLSSKPASNSKLTSARNILKTICASIVVQKTTSQTPISRSRLWSCLRAIVFQQLLRLWQLFLRNPWKNREQPPGLHTD